MRHLRVLLLGLLLGACVEHVEHAADGGADAAPWHSVFWTTPQVTLEAADFQVSGGGRTFVGYRATFAVSSDPGDATYTTLEVKWTEWGVEMGINFYFAADGATWWADEIRTYNGLDPPDWIEYRAGPYFRSQLGRDFTGDFEVGTLRFRDLRLRAFLDQ